MYNEAWQPGKHHRPGQSARARADHIRRELASLLHAKAHEFVFTSSGRSD